MTNLLIILRGITKGITLALIVVGLETSIANGSAESICYLPTENNVSYSSLTELPTGQPSKTLKYGSGDLQFGELWLPIKFVDSGVAITDRNTDGQHLIQHPLVVLIHGGCWLNEYDLKHTYALSTALSSSGYAVWSIEYRRTGDEGGGWPGTFADIKAAIEYTQSLTDYPIDLSKIVLAGHSAGGHLALLAGSDQPLVARTNISAVIGLAAITDIAEYARGKNDCQSATPAFMGGTPDEVPQQYEAANPINKTLHPNTVLLQGTDDIIVTPEFARKSGLNTQFIDDAGHFDMVHPATASYQALLALLARSFYNE